MRIIRRKLLLCTFLLFTLFTRAQQTGEVFDIPVKYLLALPEGYAQDTAKSWPLIVFLHGSGESGADLNKVKVHGPPKLVEQGKKFPFIVVSPQAADENSGWQIEILQMMLKDLKTRYRIDADRIYLTGLSMGGFGTWAWSSKYPRQFAAIAPICGGGDTAEAAKYKHLPVWCFHGGKDNTVNPELSKRMVAAIKRYNPNVRLTIYPEAGHDSWTEAYNNDSLYTWFLSHKKFRHTPVTMDGNALKEYAGVYLQDPGDTLRLELADGRLIARSGDPDLEVRPASGNLFFITMPDDTEFELKFFRNKKGKIEKFVFYSDDRPVDFRRLE